MSKTPCPSIRSFLPCVPLAALTAFAALAPAQQWLPIATQSRYRAGHGMATDPATGRPLLFGGAGVWVASRHYDADTWRWNGSQWYRCNGVIAPPADDAVVMATDTARRRTVLVALSTSPPQTWEWDGEAWTLRAPAHTPSPGGVLSGAMAFDAAHGRCVLLQAQLGETWEWNGVDWTQVVTAHAPSSRVGTRLAYDLARSKVVLFGGDDGSRAHTVFQDTWNYDGVDWTQLATANAPSPRSETAMTYDTARLRVLLYGGRANQTLFNDTWSFDGTNWTNVVPLTVPAVQVDPNMAADAVTGEVLLFTGEDTTAGAEPRTFAWNGTDWQPRALPAVPPLRLLHGLADDAHGQQLLFGGRNATLSGRGVPNFADTWLFDGAKWAPRNPPNAPTARAAFALATDTARNRVVLFGGDDATNWFGDTWTWDGFTWRNVANAGPAPRSHGAMAYDAAHRICVLHGGEDSSQQFGDTWIWNGVAWSQKAGVSPGARADAAMTFDSGRGLVFLFGGRDATFTTSNDLWQWNGGRWTLVAANTPPAPRFLHDFTYDPDRAHFVLHGGDVGDESWDWDGNNTWTPLTLGLQAISGGAAATAWDPKLRRIVSYDGGAAWACSVHAAAAVTTGSSCGGQLPNLQGAGRPFLGNAVFGAVLTRAVAGNGVVLALGGAGGSVPLPGGCTLLLQNATLVGGQLAGGTGLAEFALPVPQSMSLQGFTVSLQAGVLDGSPNIAVSNAVQLTLGD